MLTTDRRSRLRRKPTMGVRLLSSVSARVLDGAAAMVLLAGRWCIRVPHGRALADRGRSGLEDDRHFTQAPTRQGGRPVAAAVVTTCVADTPQLANAE